MGEADFFLEGGLGSLMGDDRLPERSSEAAERLALWELSDRSLGTVGEQSVDLSIKKWYSYIELHLK